MALYVLFENKSTYCLFTLFAFYLTYKCVRSFCLTLYIITEFLAGKHERRQTVGLTLVLSSSLVGFLNIFKLYFAFNLLLRCDLYHL